MPCSQRILDNSMISIDPHDPEFATQLVEYLLREAVARQASDIHIQPRSDRFEILLRIDGVLHKIGEVPNKLPTDPVARLLVLANLPTYQNQKPQEGRLRETPNQVEMRLGTFPTVHGTRAVIRLMNRADSLDRIADLGMDAVLEDQLQRLTACQDGAILMTGPAGSGKTTTLYACLREIAAASPRRSLVTIEDPVEAILDGVSQSQISANGGSAMTLASALRSVLRQDPEVLLVGEIRDEETAAAAFGASLTGHLVFSSLHATDVATALRRLVELQVPPYLIRSGLRAICSQRLLRRLCPACKVPDDDSTIGAYRAVGCEACGFTGFRGRLVIAELLRIDDASAGTNQVLDLLSSGGHVGLIREMLSQLNGWKGLRSCGDDLVKHGQTTPSEVFRVLG